MADIIHARPGTNSLSGHAPVRYHDEGDGSYSESVAAHLRGWDATDAAWYRLPVDHASGALLVSATLAAGSVDIGKVDQGTGGASAWLVTGPLTDTQLRASAVAVSLASLPAVTFASPQHVIVDSATLGTVTVSGSLGRTWTLGSGSDSVSVGNFPAGFANSDDVTDRSARLPGHVTVDASSGQAADAAAALPSTVNLMAGWDGGNVRTVSVRLKDGVYMLHVADQQARQYLELLYVEALAQTDILRQLVGERADLL